ncbi:MAG: type II toxin-antitoxin system RelE/ParE family toxin [bacterium]|nr:type II toxin-antitoxin system RelE/ParE family toxin [bacterium]
MKYSFLKPAREELKGAIGLYNQRRGGLGDEFLAEVENAIARILRQPLAWTRMSENARCCRTKRFPYGLIYQVRDHEILIVAVMHLRRRPGYWRDRILSG